MIEKIDLNINHNHKDLHETSVNEVKHSCGWLLPLNHNLNHFCSVKGTFDGGPQSINIGTNLKQSKATLIRN